MKNLFIEELRKYVTVSFDIDFQLPNLGFDRILPQQMSEVLINSWRTSPNFVLQNIPDVLYAI